MGSSGAERERGAIRAGQDPRCRSTAPPRPHSFGCKILSTHTDIAAVTFSSIYGKAVTGTPPSNVDAERAKALANFARHLGKKLSASLVSAGEK